MSPAVADCATEGATVVSDVGAADGEEVVVSGSLSVHHNLTLRVGGAGYGDSVLPPRNSGGWTSSGNAGQSLRCCGVRERIC